MNCIEAAAAAAAAVQLTAAQAVGWVALLIAFGIALGAAAVYSAPLGRS